MSYARFDDAHDDGQLSEFRKRLSAEVGVQTGRNFPIFQDREDIEWGQNWRQRIEEALDEVPLLLVIVTPGLFQSAFCRDEVARFQQREQKLGRTDLILPVYYVSAREFDDPDWRRADAMATLLWSRQYADWRDLRFEPLTSPVVRKAIAQLATRMRDAFWASPPPPGMGEHAFRASGASAGQGGQSASAASSPADTAKTEPPTHVVDIGGNGDFVSLAAAIEAAKAGDRILVRPGRYEAAVVVDKSLEIIGDGPVKDIEVHASGSYVLQFRASTGRVANLTLRQDGGGAYGVLIAQGRLDLEGCDISSATGSCVYIAGGADPRLRRNVIHDGEHWGVLVYNNGLGTLEDNEITGNRGSGVEIRLGGDPTLRRNVIRENCYAGIVVSEGGRGTLEDNDITGNGTCGAEITDGGNPVLRRNQLHHNTWDGVHAHDNGLGTLEDNDIIGNAYVGVEIEGGGNPTVRGNRVNGNAHQGVFVHDGGKGVLEDNDLTGNTRGALLIAQACEPNVTRARNKE